ncbi:hypothetical protein Tco_0112167 [Tanacetum coccineum]
MEERLFKVAMLDPSPNLLVHGERLEIRDYQLCAIWKNLGYSEWSTPAGLKLARENLQSRVKEEDSITDVENAIFDLGGDGVDVAVVVLAVAVGGDGGVGIGGSDGVMMIIMGVRWRWCYGGGDRVARGGEW